MKRFLLLMALLACWSGRAFAVCPTCSCTASATGVSFGIYQPSSATPSTGVVTMSCTVTIGTGSIAYSIDLSAGNGSFAARKMTSGSNALNYNLYTTSADAAVWGDGTSGTSVVSDSYSITVLTVKNYTVYGLMPASQNIPAGSYSDTIMVTVNY
jgi:spore coat protein U-like protein